VGAVKVALVHDHVGGAGGGGGGVRQMLELAQGLMAAGVEVTVVCHDHDPETDLARIAERAEVRAVRTGPIEHLMGQRNVWRRQFAGMRRVAELIPADADVINAHEWPALRAASRAGRKHDIPFVWTRNDETMWERGLFPADATIHPGSPTSRVRHVLYGVPDALDARRAAAIVVLDERNARSVKRCYGRTATIVRSGPAPRFYDPPDRAAAREQLGVPDGVRLAVAMGIMFPHRRFEDLIEAVARVDDAPVRARIVGWAGFNPDYADRLERLIAERGLGERVELVRTSVSDEELRAMYVAADVFVFTNQRQTWGLAPLEALASGTPVIVSSGAGVHEVLSGRPGVRIVPPERPDLIADALRELDGRASVEQTREWVRRELNDQRYAEGMLDVFRAVAA